MANAPQTNMMMIDDAMLNHTDGNVNGIGNRSGKRSGNAAIDIVYLWVDGSDREWRGRRNRAAAGLNPEQRDDLAIYSNVEGRYRDNEELRFSLRSLQENFPEHGHVFVVTDRQCPSWLKSDAGITIVDHAQLMPESSLPVFDSGHIESYVHRIDGLSERYFYLNDDIFFGSRVNVDHWFSDSGVFLAWSDEPRVVGSTIVPTDTSLTNASRLSQQWLASKLPGYVHEPRTFAHSPRPMLRSVMYAIENEVAPELFSKVRSTVFRNWSSPPIVSDFVLRWALATGRGQIRDYRSAYVCTGDPDASEQLQRLVLSKGSLDFFCINDTTDDAIDSDPRLARAHDTLSQLFSRPSCFEWSSGQLRTDPAGNALRSTAKAQRGGQPLQAESCITS
jgi:Stealth protein CR2, conserved region 2/Stealth protein CR1, conserved region 1/Stealth protein CR4, conserved region 4